MFRWVRGLSSNQVPLEGSENRDFIERETPATSLSSRFELKTSEYLDLEDPFSVSKDLAISRKNKPISKWIISMFQRKSKDVSTDDNRRNRSLDSLLDESTENSVSREAEYSSLLDEETKKGKRRCKKVVRRIFDAERKKKQFRRKPLDDYAKRKLQDSRDSGWEAMLPASPSLSSLVNEEAAFSASTPIRKINPKPTSPRISSKMAHNGVAVYRSSLLFTREDVEDLFETRTRSTEDFKRLIDDNSSVLSDSGICESSGSFNLNETKERSRSAGGSLDKLRVIKFSHSDDCVAHLLADIKSCGKCASRCDASRSRGETRPSGFPAKVSSRTVSHSEELRIVKRVTSADCIPSYIKPPLKNAERRPSLATCSTPSNLDVDDRSNDFLEYHRSVEGNLSTRVRSRISKSAAELFEGDPLCNQNEIAEFSSVNDLLCASLQRPGNSDEVLRKSRDGFSVEEKLKVVSGEESVTEDVDAQRNITSFGYEKELNNENRFFSSLNASYVLTMYV